MVELGQPDFRKTAVTAVLIVLSFIGTMFIRIPIPATNGYFNLGDMFIILAALWLGPYRALLVGLLGPTAADLIGFPQFILATAVTKGAEGLVAGLIAQRLFRKQSARISILAAFAGAAIMVLGYFVFEAFIYPEIGKFVSFFNVTDLGAAIAEVPFNVAQGVIGAIGGVALWRAVTGGRPPQSQQPEPMS